MPLMSTILRSKFSGKMTSRAGIVASLDFIDFKLFKVRLVDIFYDFYRLFDFDFADKRFISIETSRSRLSSGLSTSFTKKVIFFLDFGIFSDYPNGTLVQFRVEILFLFLC
jgi:hypothetical protein